MSEADTVKVSRLGNMEFGLQPVDRLKPYDNNPRQITDEEVAQLAVIIEANGFLDPIEVDDNFTIVVGHRRRLAAIKLGLVRVPTIRHVGMTEDEARLYRIANNKIGEGVQWNRALLSDEMSALEGFISSPLEAGFTDSEVLKLFDLDRGLGTATDAAASGEGEKKDTDGAPAEGELGPYIRPGQEWHIGPCIFRVYQNLNDDQLRKAEKAIAQIQKIMKEPATLEGQSFKEYLAQAQRLEDM